MGRERTRGVVWEIRDESENLLAGLEARRSTLLDSITKESSLISEINMAIQTQDRLLSGGDSSEQLNRLTSEELDYCRTQLSVKQLQIAKLELELRDVGKELSEFRASLATNSRLLVWAYEEDQPGAGSSSPPKTNEKRGVVLMERDRHLAAKLYRPLPTVTAAGTIAHYAGVSGSEQGCVDLVRDMEILMKHQLDLCKSEANWQHCGILPLCRVLSLHTDKAESFRVEFFMAAVTPFAAKGTVEEAVNLIMGKRIDYWFEAELVLTNLIRIIKALENLNLQKFNHGNIKPSNLFIGQSGTDILLGDFMPKEQFFRIYNLIQAGLRGGCPDNYLSPELYTAAKDGVFIDSGTFNLEKHDVFCLGLSLYFVVMRQDPDPAMFKSRRRLQDSLLKLSTSNERLNKLIKTMLTWDVESRPGWTDLLAEQRKPGIANAFNYIFKSFL